MPRIWDDLPVGVLNDVALKRLGDAGEVITQDFDSRAVAQSCYDFRIGNTLIDPSKPENERQIQIEDGREFLIPPRSTRVVILKEKILLPPSCVARFILKGKFFTVGLAPVNTYADPGFGDQMGVVLTNFSNNYIKLKSGERIAKAEFEKMPEGVETPYRSQHGFQAGLWPVFAQYIATDSDLKKHGVDPYNEIEIRKVYGEIVAKLSGDLKYYSNNVWLQVMITLMLFTILIYFAGSEHLSIVVSIMLGVVANLISQFAPRLLSSLFGK